MTHKRVQKRTNGIGKPPLCIDTNKKYSVYPDASNYKHGTANNKIIQLREHLTRSNTVSSPDLLKEEQAIIDSMFSEKGRQASRGREGYSSAIYSGLQKQRKKKRSSTKPHNISNKRGISSAAGDKKNSINTNLHNVMNKNHFKNILKVASK